MPAQSIEPQISQPKRISTAEKTAHRSSIQKSKSNHQVFGLNSGNNIKITNISKQMFPIQIRPPGSDFYIGERQAMLMPGRSIVVQSNHVLPAQIANLKARRKVSVMPVN